MKESKTLLIIEDEPAILGFLRSSLEKVGWQILEARRGLEGLQETASHQPNVILLDLGLPHAEALSSLKALRQWTSIPVILMVIPEQEKEKHACLEAGADDYLVKPFETEELIVRLHLALRHAEGRIQQELPIYEYQGFRMDLMARRAWFRNKEVYLSPRQYVFLSVLARHAGHVISHHDLIEQAWGEGHKVSGDGMRVFVYQLRKKIEINPARPSCLKTDPGVGYWLESPKKNNFQKKFRWDSDGFSSAKCSTLTVY